MNLCVSAGSTKGGFAFQINLVKIMFDPGIRAFWRNFARLIQGNRVTHGRFFQSYRHYLTRELTTDCCKVFVESLSLEGHIMRLNTIYCFRHEAEARPSPGVVCLGRFVFKLHPGVRKVSQRILVLPVLLIAGWDLSDFQA